MRTKRYRGESVHSLMRQVREELGENVLLLSTTQEAQDTVEIEIGLLDDNESAGSAQPNSEYSGEQEGDISLGEVADLFRDEDIFTALPLHGVNSGVVSAIKKSCRSKKWTTDTLTRSLGKILKFDPYISEDARFLAVMGAKHSGRTTTIIKLTTKLQQALGLKIGIIAGDIEDEEGAYHLCVMGKMLDVPVVGLDEALAPEIRLQEAAERLGECDLIFIDTPSLDGLGPKRTKELQKVLDGDQGVERFLMMPAHSSEETLTELLGRARMFECSRAIVSFTDKAGRLGSLINVAYDSQLPLAFVSRGDRIPEDIEPASPRRLAWLLGRLVQ